MTVGASRCRSAIIRIRVSRSVTSSKHASIGVSLPGTVEEPTAPVSVDGQLRTTLEGNHSVAELLEILNEYVARMYAARR
jgi:hypothetical protein